MHPLIKAFIKRGKLVYLWVTRILLAPNRFDVPWHARIRYAISGGFISDQVALYGLTARTKRAYLSEFDWYRSRWINEPFDAMLNNKIVCSEMLERHISVPPIYFIKNKGRLVSHGDAPPVRVVADTVPTLQDVGSMFLKPLAAGKGKGVRRLDAADGEFWIDRVPSSKEQVLQLLQREDGWFLSGAVEQHPDLAAIYEHTTNTIRLITMRMSDGTAKIFFAVLRMGTAATVPVDNGSRGGLVSRIDLDTGTLSEARTLWSHGVFTAHPDSNATIQGARVPLWDEVKESVLRAVDAVPYLQFIAWDILVTPDGPCVIEANTSSGVNIIQIWGPQRDGELGDFYRAHGVIR
ncbi:sugar-transfer associated ATP-grasp domain-containing protein [Microbacterium alcoholitolerans]|uniref:sugar-transfer associated ATP-grasp domain-containing protein n=1 Tax=unclassified Microbacterium TaxID=2609290 RepID=UPI003D17E7A6